MFNYFLKLTKYIGKIFKADTDILKSGNDTAFNNIVMSDSIQNLDSSKVIIQNIPINNLKTVIHHIPTNKIISPYSSNTSTIIIQDISVNNLKTIIPHIPVDKIPETYSLLLSPVSSLGTGLSLSTGITSSLLLIILLGGGLIWKNSTFFSYLFSPFKWVVNKLLFEDDSTEEENKDTEELMQNILADSRERALQEAIMLENARQRSIRSFVTWTLSLNHLEIITSMHLQSLSLFWY